MLAGVRACGCMVCMGVVCLIIRAHAQSCPHQALLKGCSHLFYDVKERSKGAITVVVSFNMLLLC